jgi:hypothetical protein
VKEARPNIIHGSQNNTKIYNIAPSIGSNTAITAITATTVSSENQEMTKSQPSPPSPVGMTYE